MNIGVVNVVSESVSEIIRSLSLAFEDVIKPYFLSDDFGAGVNEFIVAIIAVDSDIEVNNRFCVPNEKVGSYKHWLSQDSVKFISIALPMNPDKIEKMTEAEVRQEFCEILIEKLKNPIVKIPKKFNYDKFSEKMNMVLQIYGRATFGDSGSVL